MYKKKKKLVLKIFCMKNFQIKKNIRLEINVDLLLLEFFFFNFPDTKKIQENVCKK